MCTIRNLYFYLSRFHHQNPEPSSSHLKDWEDTSVPELRVFISLRMAMGMNHKPERRHYWSTNLFYHMPLFPETMKWDHFDQLSQYLHLVDNEGSHPPNDHLWKLRPVIKTCRPDTLTRWHSACQLKVHAKRSAGESLQRSGKSQQAYRHVVPAMA